MSALIFVSIIFLIFIFGVSIALLLDTSDIFEIYSLAWLFGSGLVTLSWFLMYFYFSVSFSLQSIFTTLVVCNLLSFSYIMSFKKNVLKNLVTIKKFSEYKNDIQKNEVLFVILLFTMVIVFFVFIQNMFWPVTDWDAIALYDFRAKVILQTGSLEEGKNLGYFFQYPLYTSLLHALTYMSGLGISKVWYAILYHAAIINFFVLLKKKTSKSIGLIGSFIFATTPIIFTHSQMAYTNLAYTVFTGLGIIYLWQWIKDSSNNLVLIGGLLVGLGTWVRITEPFYYIAFVIVILGFIKKYKSAEKKIALFLNCCVASIFILLFRYPWDSLIYTYFSSNVNTPTATLSLVHSWNISTLYSKAFLVITYLSTYSLPVYSANINILLFLIVNDIRNREKSLFIEYLSIFLLLLTIFVGALITSLWLESWNRIGDSVARMSMLLLPLILYTTCINPAVNRKMR